MIWRSTILILAEHERKSWWEMKALVGKRVQWREFVEALCYTSKSYIIKLY